MSNLSREVRRRFPMRWVALACGLFAVVLATPPAVMAQETPPPTPPVESQGSPAVTEAAAPAPAAESQSPPAVAEAAAPVEQEDVAAAAYAMKCLGCHTIGGGTLTGPDLKNSAGYPRQTVRDAIKRMEKNVGPLSDPDVESLTDFLLSADAAARVESHRKQLQMREAASLAPPNAALGRALFFGSDPFANRGAACAACHQAGGRGGNLATSLEDAFTRLGEQPLLATTESPGFPVMRAMYTPQPVTKQEALHVVKFLEEVSSNPAPPATVPLHLAGSIGAVIALLLLGKFTAKRAAGTRARMVAEAHQRNDRGANHRRTK